MSRCLRAALAVLAFFVLAPCAHAQAITAQWTKKTTVNWLPDGPGARSWTRMFYDSGSNRIVVYGGSAGGGYKSDIWQYDTHSDTWLGLEVPALDCPGYLGPDGGPDGRDAHSDDYDPYNHLYWVVAGGGGKCGLAHGEVLPVRTAGTGTTTSVIVDPNLPATESGFYKDWLVNTGSSAYVSSNTSYVSGYDAATKTLTLATPIAGLAPGSSYTVQFFTSGQTWYYSPITRKWRSMEGPHWGSVRPSPVVVPPPRNTPGFAYSPKDNILLFVGGGKNGQGANDTWALDLVTRTWSQKTADSSSGLPYKLQEITNSLAYDEADDVFILFGGRCADSRCATIGKPSGDTWAYKLSTNTWTRMTPAVSPPARTQGTMYYDRNAGLVVLFGGATTDIYSQYPSGSNLLNDLWVYRYSTNTWTQITTATTPAARYLHMMAFDPVEGKGILYGGNNYVTSREVWTLEINDPAGTPVPYAGIDVVPATEASDGFILSAARSGIRSGGIASYAWDFGDGQTSTGIQTSHAYASAGVYPVRLTVTSDLGISATTWYRLDTTATGGGGGTSNQAPVAAITVSPTSGTTATVFTFNGSGSTDSDGTIASFSWNFGDGATASGSTATHQYSTAGTYNVALTVTDNLGASGVTNFTLAVGSPGGPPTIGFQRQISGTVTNGTVTAVLVDGVSVPFTASGSTFTATLNVTYPQTVTVTIQASGPAGSASQSATVSVP